MKYSSVKVPSFIKMFGGKSRYARQYIRLFPDVSKYDIYCEPFAGGAGVLMNKERSKREILADLNPKIAGCLMTLRDSGEEVINCLFKHFYSYSVETFRNAKTIIDHKNFSNSPTGTAAYIAANRMSRSGLFKDFAESNRLRGGQMGDKNAWENFLEFGIHKVIERLQGVIIYHESAFNLFYKINLVTGQYKGSKGRALYFLDPPYLHETRVTKNSYDYEMTQEQHGQLLNDIKMLRGKVFLCGYRSSLYASHLDDWIVHEFNRPADSGQTKVKTRRVEVLWESP